MSQRIFAGLWLLFSLGMGWMATSFEVQFAYEPVGPRAWPILLAMLMALASLYLIFKPGDDVEWPAFPVMLRIGGLAVTLLLYAMSFEWLGFPLATALMTVMVGRLFGGGWMPSLVTGLVMGVGMYFFFDSLLDVILPIGKPVQMLGG